MSHRVICCALGLRATPPSILSPAVLGTADDQLTALRLLCSLLPPANRDLLQALLGLLAKIASAADEVRALACVGLLRCIHSLTLFDVSWHSCDFDRT